MSVNSIYLDEMYGNKVLLPKINNSVVLPMSNVKNIELIDREGLIAALERDKGNPFYQYLAYGKPGLLQEEGFKDGDVITVEPWRSAGFPVIKDCMVDRTAFDKIMQAGGYVSVRTGAPQDANAILIPKQDADEAMDCASCIGCGACVAACKNGSAMLFVSSKVSQLALLPQGKPEAAKRAKAMVAKMDELGFGNCTNTRACEAVCPKCETIANIARLNREFIWAKLKD